MHDAELARAAAGGDQDAFAAVYDRYADRLHDFCHSVLRDRDEARDAVQDTFVLAWQRLGQLRDPAKLRSWLFAIARHESVRRARRRGRAIPTEDSGVDVAAPGADPGDAVSRDDAAAIVWAAAAGLSERDRALLDLHVRQGLDGEELGDAIGVSAGHAHVLMTRLRGQVERSLGALLVARLGREGCEELQRVLEGWDGTYTPLWRKRVARHVDDCDVCSERRRVLASPMALLPAMAAVAVPESLREEVMTRVRLISAGEPLPSGAQPRGWRRRRDGFPPPLFTERRTRVLAAVAAAGFVLVVALGGAYALGGDDEDASVDADGRGGGRDDETATTAATSTTVAGAALPPVPSDPGATTTTRPRGGSGGGGGAPGAPGAPAPGAPAPLPDTTAPSVSGVGVSPATFYDQAGSGCAPQTATVSASVGDAGGVASVVMIWSSSAGSGSKAMAGAGTYSATVGPFASTPSFATISITVRATDLAGNVSEGYTSAELQHCLI